MIDLKKFKLREDDIVKEDGHVYCKNCNQRVDGELLKSEIYSIIPRKNCQCDIKRAEEKAQRDKQARISMLKRNCFSSLSQHKYVFDKFIDKQSQAFRVAYNYSNNFKQMLKDNVGLLFYGDVGAGKTFLSCAIANKVIEDYQDQVKIMNFSQIINQLQKSAFKIDSNEIINRLSDISLLVLDDLGVERDTSYAREQVYNIINARYLKNKPTIFTTNLSLEVIQDPNIDLEYQRIYSRILEMTVPVKVVGEDYRKKIHQEKLQKYKDLLLFGGDIENDK